MFLSVLMSDWQQIPRGFTTIELMLLFCRPLRYAALGRQLYSLLSPRTSLISSTALAYNVVVYVVPSYNPAKFIDLRAIYRLVCVSQICYTTYVEFRK